MIGSGPPFRAIADGTECLVDRSGEKVKLLGIAGRIFHDLKFDPQWESTICALVSCTDEPIWAQECLEKFKIYGGQHSLMTAVHSSQIYKSNKQIHFQNLRKEYPDIAFDEMVFFDNERWNIDCVRKLGVHCIYCPDGLTEDIWERAMEQYHLSKTR